MKLLAFLFLSIMPAKDTAIVDAKRAERVAQLKADNGWLTLVGLSWLAPGKQTIGRAGDNTIVLQTPNAAEHLGVFELNDRTVKFTAAQGAGVTSGGSAVTTLTLDSDVNGKPTVLSQGSVSFYVIDRGGKLGVRIKDAKSPTRTGFAGLTYFAHDPSWRMEATFEPHTAPKRVKVPTAVGVDEEHVVPGVVRFQHGKDALALEVFEDGDGLMIVFADATSGKETYGAGRFLYAAKPTNGRVWLDFNLAENPPCAFTAFATCPLPPPGNRLNVRVEAGEKTPAGH